jgi:trigger factor
LTSRVGQDDANCEGALYLDPLGFLDFWWEHRMTDEPQPADTGTRTDATTPTEPPAAAPAEAAEGEKKEVKVSQKVDIRDVGPCKKHIQVTIDRTAIDQRLDEKFHELMKGEKGQAPAAIPGFRPGKAPRKLFERRFQTEVNSQVKAELLLASLEQLAKEHQIAALAPPEIDPSKVEIPKDGPLVYEFDIEVRPEFDLPNYRGLKLKRPVKTFTDADVDRELRRMLSRHGQIIPKPEGNAQEGDILIADIEFRFGERVLNQLTEHASRVESRLAFKDGVAEHFAVQVQGASAGDTRVVDIVLANNVADPAFRGKTVQATFNVKEVKTLRLPELNAEYLHRIGVRSEAQLHELVRVMLKRRLEYTQHRSAREQVIRQIAAASQWELPRDLLASQARQAMNRRIMEMRSEGIAEEEIRGQLRLLEQDIFNSTALSLKEHFVLQKIAEVEKIDVTEEDIDAEIESIAQQEDSSARRVRARLEKEEMLDALRAELTERKALELILESAEYEDVPLDPQTQVPVGTVEVQTVPGEIEDPTAPPPPKE